MLIDPSDVTSAAVAYQSQASTTCSTWRSPAGDGRLRLADGVTVTAAGSHQMT